MPDFLEQLPFSVQQKMAAHEEVSDMPKLAKFADGYVATAKAREFEESCAVMVFQSSSDSLSQSHH